MKFLITKKSNKFKLNVRFKTINSAFALFRYKFTTGYQHHVHKTFILLPIIGFAQIIVFVSLIGERAYPPNYKTNPTPDGKSFQPFSRINLKLRES